MKKYSFLIFLSVLLLKIYPQAYKINVVSDLFADSLYLQSYNKEKHSYQNFQSLKYQNNIDFQQ